MHDNNHYQNLYSPKPRDGRANSARHITKIKEAALARKRFYWKVDWEEYCRTELRMFDEDIRKAAKYAS